MVVLVRVYTAIKRRHDHIISYKKTTFNRGWAISSEVCWEWERFVWLHTARHVAGEGAGDSTSGYTF